MPDSLDYLVATHPRLFLTGRPSNSHLSPGWTALVDKLCTDIDQLVSDSEAQTFRVIQIKEKFGGLRFYFSLNEQRTIMLDAVNHGTRIRVEPENPSDQFNSISRLVKTAEATSAATCEVCGEAGRMRVLTGDFSISDKGFFTLNEDKIAQPLPNGWLKCLCEDHVHGAASAWAGHFNPEEDDDE